MGIGELAQQAVLDGSLLLAVPVAVLAGLVSFASPCVLPLVPGYLGYVSGMAGGTAGARVPVAVGTTTAADGPASGGPAVVADGGVAPAAGREPRRPGRWRVLLGASLFVGGFTLVFVLFGVLAGSVGGLVHQWGDVLTRVLGVVVVLMGVVFLGWVPWAQRERRFHLAPTAGLWGAPLLGVVFGLGWAPCIGPTLVAVYTLALDGASAGRGGLLSVAYCVGLGLPFLLLAAGLDRSARVTGWLRRHRLVIMRVGGAVLVAVGLALVTGLWGQWTASVQGLVASYRTVL